MNYKLYKAEWTELKSKSYHSREFIVKDDLIYWENSIVDGKLYYEGTGPEPYPFNTRIIQYSAMTSFVRDVPEEEAFLKFL